MYLHCPLMLPIATYQSYFIRQCGINLTLQKNCWHVYENKETTNALSKQDHYSSWKGNFTNTHIVSYLLRGIF